jgi:hypothetical protein
MRALWLAFGLVFGTLAMQGCEKVGGPPVQPTASPTATATSSPAPGACQTPDTGNPNMVLVGIASGFAATTSTYGNIAGYAVVDPTGASPPPSSATVIDHTVSGVPIKSTNVIQFANLEPSSSGLIHSAVGFAGNAFPAKPYAFPSPQPSQIGSAVSTTLAWSTGLLGTPAQDICYSREFTLSPGTYFFGDYNYYNITTFQGVLVVSP